MKDHLRLLFSIFRLLDEPLGLLANPCRVGMPRRFCDEHFPCLQAQKHQHVEIMDAFGRHRLHRKEIATPERLAVPIQEVGPRV